MSTGTYLQQDGPSVFRVCVKNENSGSGRAADRDRDVAQAPTGPQRGQKDGGGAAGAGSKGPAWESQRRRGSWQLIPPDKGQIHSLVDAAPNRWPQAVG